MKNFATCLFLIFSLCGFSSLVGQSGTLDVESKNQHWEASRVSNAVIKAFNTDSQTELLIDLSNLLPTSPYCISNKKIKDIKISVTINKIAKENESNWEKAFGKTHIYFSGKTDSADRKIHGSNLIRNNHKAKKGPLTVGTLEFLAPITCNNIDNMKIKISGMKNGNKNLPTLDFTIKLPKQ